MSPLVITVPLIALAVPSVLSGLLLVNVTMDGVFLAIALFLAGLWKLDMTARGMLAHTPPFWLAILGIAGAWSATVEA